MTDNGETGFAAAPQGDAGQREQPLPPEFGQEEAEAVADAQDEAVKEGLLPPSRDQARTGDE